MSNVFTRRSFTPHRCTDHEQMIIALGHQRDAAVERRVRDKERLAAWLRGVAESHRQDAAVIEAKGLDRVLTSQCHTAIAAELDTLARDMDGM